VTYTSFIPELTNVLFYTRMKNQSLHMFCIMNTECLYINVYCIHTHITGVLQNPFWIKFNCGTRQRCNWLFWVCDMDL